MVRYLLMLTLMLVSEAAAATPDPAFKIFIEHPGVYRLTYEALAAAGFEAGDVPSESIGLSNQGAPVPVWVDDAGDRIFGPGDSIEFVGERLSDDGLYFHEYSTYNVYWLTFDGSATRRMAARRSSPAAVVAEPAPLERRIHLERDHLLIRVRDDEIRTRADADLWFWEKLTNIDPRPTVVEFDLAGLERGADRTVDLRVGVRGISRPHPRQTGDRADHHIELTLNGEAIGSGEWDDRQAHTVEVLGLDQLLFEEQGNRLELRIPSRQSAAGDDPLVDVVMLNWVEVVYPHSGRVPREGQVDLTRAATGAPAVGPTAIEIQGGDGLRLYTETGERVEPFVTSGSFPGFDTPTIARFELTDGGPFVVLSGAPREVDLIERDEPSDLHGLEHRADYLMISHARLMDAIEPLADFHRQRGLDVMVVDVEQIYDEFNDGIIHPRAIRDFIDFAYHSWRDPAPAFVLLVGDASWDTKNLEVDDRFYANWVENQIEYGDDFGDRKVTVYAERSALNHRQLVPTWNYTSHEGHSASDNFFVAVDGDDYAPDLAIGRFPVTEPEEIEAIVAKTIAYAASAEPGPWHRSLLWITNESQAFQQSSDFLALRLAERGFASTKVYPSSEEVSNESHQAFLQDAFNQGQLIVHFLGHGGRHIWRTGPPDFRKNHDLFTLEHVQALEPTRRLSFVLSMTCYSAPFDHPNQDSIGELFLRVPDRGAVGVFAASWRNSPSRNFSQLLLDGLTEPGNPVGLAIMQAKRQTQNRTLVETYNLLGDPAIALAVPHDQIELEVVPDGEAARVRGRLVSSEIAGEGVVEWVDEALQVVHSVPVTVEGSSFEVTAAAASAADRAAAIGVRAWVLDRASGRDGVGWRVLAAADDVGETREAAAAIAAGAEADATGVAPAADGNGKGR